MNNFLGHLIMLLILGYASVFGQVSENTEALSHLRKKGEVYFTFSFQSRERLEELTKIISIDKVVDNRVYAYANAKQFRRFSARNIGYEVLVHPGDRLLAPKMFHSSQKGSKLWYEQYPTYEAYLMLMEEFAAAYPSLCRIEEIGTTVQGRKLLFAKISDGVSSEEPEPKFMYTATMHGDEPAGYVLMLRLIEHLLTEYHTNDRIRNLVNNCQIYINPLANPDGTFAGGDSSVAGAARGNSNFVDLNRNFPNQVMGDHPDAEQWQPETEAMMNFAESHDFVMSANFHGGAEVVNYPWDSWTSSSRLTADDAWWQYVSREYADFAQANSPGDYMTDLNNGITNGGDWYVVYGSRQDYMNWFKRCRELTIELSHVKMVPEPELLNLWNYNYDAMLSYMERSLEGISGRVQSSHTGSPIAAGVEIVDYDRDRSDVYATAQFGTFHRPIMPGVYDIRFTHDGYKTVTLPNITVQADTVINVNVTLEPDETKDKVMFSGVLRDPAGNLIGAAQPDTFDVTVRLFDDGSDGNLRYTEYFTDDDTCAVVIDKGELRMVLGTGKGNRNLADIVGEYNNLWVELTIDDDTLSRVPLTSSPYITSR